MPQRPMVTLDGNEAAASVAHRINEVIAIYPHHPVVQHGRVVGRVVQPGQDQHLGGPCRWWPRCSPRAARPAAVHGSLQAGALTTTFTASQGLLLMIPNMGKIAGELTAFTMHVSARAIGHNGISIFGDHSDVMSCRQTGFAMLASASVQEAHDFACIAQAASLRSRVPFLHFFDGFRTSHEVAKIERLEDDDLRAMINDGLVAEHRARALRPEAPVVRGTTQNPDAYFQTREAISPFFAACPAIVQEEMDKFAKLTGRAYRLFDYFGAPDAERVVVVMGSGAETIHEYVEWALARGQKIGVLKARLFRPFSATALAAVLPATVKTLCVLDRVKEPGAAADPLCLDVSMALQECHAEGVIASMPRIIPGRFGLAGKEFTPAHVKAVFDELAKAKPKTHFTVGIEDDVMHSSLASDPDFDIESADVKRAMFYGLGSDGTVGANKNSIKIIAEETDNYGQGYFVYDSKKAGAVTISHLRFGPRPIRSAYLIRRTNFVACHNTSFLDKYDMLESAAEGATFLLNTPFNKDEVWESLPREVQQDILARKLKFFVIDAFEVARQTGMGVRINTIMQTCFFAISGVLPREEAIEQIKKSIKKTYGRKGDAVVQKNFEAVDTTLAHLHEVAVPKAVTSNRVRPATVATEAPEFVQKVTALMMAGKGDLVPVSGFAADGTWPVATTQWEKAQHRPGHPGVGRGPVHPVQQVLLHVPARRHPAQGLRRRPAQ